MVVETPPFRLQWDSAQIRMSVRLLDAMLPLVDDRNVRVEVAPTRREGKAALREVSMLRRDGQLSSLPPMSEFLDPPRAPSRLHDEPLFMHKLYNIFPTMKELVGI